MKLALIFVLATLASSAHARPCPALLGITATGALYEDRGGVWVRQSYGVLEQVLKTGCYPEDGPSPTSSVTLEVERGVSPKRLDDLFALLARAGWTKDRITIGPWSNAPHRPVVQTTPAPR